MPTQLVGQKHMRTVMRKRSERLPELMFFPAGEYLALGRKMLQGMEQKEAIQK